MKKTLILLVLSCLSFNAFTQSQNQFDTNKERHGLWIKYYTNGNIRYQGEFEHGKEIGVFKFYHAAAPKNPIIVKEFNSHDSKAMVKFYTKKGVLESEGTTQGKTRIGKWVYYHRDGETIMQEENYLNGKLEGDYKTYFSDKNPTVIAIYKNGVLHGKFKQFSIKGHVYQDLTYVDGKLQGEAIFYDRKTGDIKEKGQFLNDERVGIWEFSIDGEMVKGQEIKRKPVPK